MPKPRDWSQDECDYLVAAWNDVSQDASLTRGRIADLVVSRLQSQFGQHTRFKCNSVKTIYDQRKKGKHWSSRTAKGKPTAAYKKYLRGIRKHDDEHKERFRDPDQPERKNWKDGTLDAVLETQYEQLAARPGGFTYNDLVSAMKREVGGHWTVGIVSQRLAVLHRSNAGTDTTDEGVDAAVTGGEGMSGKEEVGEGFDGSDDE